MSEVEEVTDETVPPEPQAEPAPLPSESDRALQRYQHRLRRHRFIYFGLLAVVVIAIGVLVGVAWVNGEVANTTLHTVSRAPLPLNVEAASVRPQEAWHTSDQAAIGTPRARGTIVTYSAHTVRGRDARTGAQTWYYTRSDRTVCTAIQTSSTAIAIYENHGNCDEVTALSANTGDRRWTRTLDKDGMPVNGRPQYQVSDSTVLISTSSVIYAIDPVTGYDRWEYTRQGCAIQHVVQGTAGVMISQDCHHVDCPSGEQFCGNGVQLLMRDGSAGRDDKMTANPDRLRWNRIGDTDIPVSADQFVSALNRTTHDLDTNESITGAPGPSVTLNPAPAVLGNAVVSATVDTEVVWIGGVTYAVNATSQQVTWTVATPSAPTVESGTIGVVASMDTARITAPGAPGIHIIDGNTGHTAQKFALPVPQQNSTIYSLGTGFLVSSAAGTVAYK